MLTLLYPWLLALAPLPLLVRWLVPPKNTKRVAVRVPFTDRFHQSSVDTTSSPQGVLRSLIVPSLVWLLILLALVRPQRIDDPLEKNLPTRDLLLLVDLSGSMDQQDFTDAEGEKSQRLEAVKKIVGDFLEHREGDRVGLVVFGDSPFLQAPFSTDLTLSRRLLEDTTVGMAGPKTALGDAIGLGINLFNNSEMPAKTIIALTDGNDTKSQVPPVEAARIAVDRDIRIHTVAIGDPTTAGEDKLDEATLRKVAESTGGKYFFAQDSGQLADCYAELDKIETREINTASFRPRHDLYHWPLIAALALSLLSRVPFRRIKRQAMTESATPAELHVDPLSGKIRLQ